MGELGSTVLKSKLSPETKAICFRFIYSFTAGVYLFKITRLEFNVKDFSKSPAQITASSGPAFRALERPFCSPGSQLVCRARRIPAAVNF